jgi:hypothetical protein
MVSWPTTFPDSRLVIPNQPGGFTWCLIDDVVGQIGHKRFGVVAIDCSNISTMRDRFNGLYVD